MRRLFLFAYACSGLAGLVYEVSWTRLLTLTIGHTTAAASAVVAAFLGGLAAGASGGAVVGSRLTARQSLYAYIGLEIFVGAIALVLPLEISSLTPVLQRAYRDGAGGALFPVVRLSACLAVVLIPATALGATFPMAVRWFTEGSRDPARSTGALYALNTAGAAIGALLAGFLMIPAIGVSGTMGVGVAFSALAAATVALVLQLDQRQPDKAVKTSSDSADRSRTRKARGPRSADNGRSDHEPTVDRQWLAPVVLGLSGFAALIHEIVWTRVLSLVFGPTIYAFAATLACVIAGVAVGSGLGTLTEKRMRRPAMWLAIVLAGAAITSAWTASLAGQYLPNHVAAEMANAPAAFGERLRQNLLMTAALIVPTAACLGAAFPLALMTIPRRNRESSKPFGVVYAVNTIGAVCGSLAAGFLLIPLLGLQSTLTVVNGCLIAAAIIVCLPGHLSMADRIVPLAASAVAALLMAFGPPWDRALLASGAYLYAAFVPKDLDLSTLLKAGTLLYYREGAASTVSVKRLTGTTTLAVDGKVDASNRSDMLTQKLLAHLPLLLHDDPREICIIGLGSGVTLGSALVHPVQRVDVVEISPEVVEASAHFLTENHHALDDPRSRLIVGDGRSHLLLSTQSYDAIISEPSNPWIAGVAALFTREFFLAARERLAPHGIICQWAHTYNISDRDLRSIVKTFTSVFPNGTAWLVGSDDVLLVASNEPSADGIGARLPNIERSWTRPGVAGDLAEVSALDPFSILSLFAGGPGELADYGRSASLLDDDRMTLEFSGPRDVFNIDTAENSTVLASLAGNLSAEAKTSGTAGREGPAFVRARKASATAGEWRNRARMMAKSDVHSLAYDDYVRALTIDAGDRESIDGLVRSAILSGRTSDALSWLKALTGNRPQTPETLAATSKLLAADGSAAEALSTAQTAARLFPQNAVALEQLASLLADSGNAGELEPVVESLKKIAPEGSATYYYAAVVAILRDRIDDAARNAERSLAIDPQFAPAYDLVGAAYTKLDQPAKARDAFLASLRFDPHDSTAYTNLGLLALAAGNRPEAANYFAEALGLAPNSPVAREGLARAQ